MPTLQDKLSPADMAAMKAFLDSAERPEGTFGFHELQGFLFTIASSPETIPPSKWMPLIGNDEELEFRDEKEAQQYFSQLMTLYNEINGAVLARAAALPTGCAFRDDTLANFEDDAPIAQWSRGFTAGHSWLADVWDEYLPETMEEEYTIAIMTLSCFGSRKLADAYFADTKCNGRSETKGTFAQFADTMRNVFPDALASYAHLGRSIFEVLIQERAAAQQPARSEKIGRNEPCPCGSGKKYKKCCGGTVH